MRFFALFLFALPVHGASLFAAASSEYGTNTVPASLTAAYPMTISCRVYVASTNTGYAFVSVGTSTTARQTLFQSNDGTWSALSNDGTGSSSATVSLGAEGMTANTWYHVAARFEDAGDRELFVDGSSVVSNGSTRTQASPTSIIVGARIAAGAVGFFHSGGICDVAVWNVALTDEEIASLANYAAAPTDIRMASLVFYAPMEDGLSTTAKNYCGAPMAFINTPSSTAHPKVVLP